MPAHSIYPIKINLVLLTLVPSFTFLASVIAAQQPAPQNPSPMVDQTRPHPRIARTEAVGRRWELKTLKGARLFAGPLVNPNRPAPLMVHFHGAPWLIELHVASHLPRTALVTVQLGAGSNAYRKPFMDGALFQSLLAEANELLGLKRGWSSITMAGFSAGYGGIREILKTPQYFQLVNQVVLLDGLHTSYLPEGKPLADGGTLDASGLEVFVRFAQEAMTGKKSFVLTHSEIFPGTYASTTECADYLLQQLGLLRRPQLREGPMGMQQLSVVDVKGFHLRGYAGNSAPDHVDHLHAMPAWFKLLAFRS